MGSCIICLQTVKIYRKTIFIVLYPLALLPIFLLNNTSEMRCFYVVCLMAGFWVLEVLPSGVTAFIPFFLFPLMGIMDSDRTAECYMKDANMMFLGGLILALAVEYCNLHTRISLHAIKLIGCSLRRLNFGLITLTMLISMWISNTAATAMMIPIIRGILQELEQQGLCRGYKEADDPLELREPTKVTMCFYISVAYAASIGGLGCILGSGTNLAFKGIYESAFPRSEGLTFTDWMAVNVPIMLLIMYFGWIWIQMFYMGMCRPHSEDAEAVSIGREGEEIAKRILVEKLKEMGPLSTHEILVAFMFFLAVMLWFFRHPGFISGWPKLFTDIKVKDSTVAIIIVFLLSVLPSRLNFLWTKRHIVKTLATPKLISWSYIQERMHWSLMFLLGSGFALGEAIEVSGFGELVADKLEMFTYQSKYVLLTIVILLTAFATQFTSNVAIANIFLPIAVNVSIKAKLHPMFLMMPVCLGSSFAYCLPVATPPNAIAAGPCNMKTFEMIKVGLGLQIISFLVTMAVFPPLGDLVWDFNKYPEWAMKEMNNTQRMRFSSLL